MSVSADMHRDEVAARAGCALRSDDRVARQVADVRQEVERAVQIARAKVIVLQRLGERDDTAVGRDRLDGPLFPLVHRVDPAGARGLALFHVARVGKHEAIAGAPASGRFSQRQRRMPGPRFDGHPGKGRRDRRAVNGELAEVEEAVPELLRIGHARVERRVGDDDFGRTARGDRVGGRAHLEMPNRGHRGHAVIAHDHQVGDPQPAVGGGGEPQRAVHGQRVRRRGHGIDRDDMVGIDVDHMVGGRHLSALPRAGVRPAARAHAADRRPRRVLREVGDVVGQRLRRRGMDTKQQRRPRQQE